jgi:hypothetical protein
LFGHHLALLPNIFKEWHVANIYKTKMISCATNQKHVIYGNSIVMMFYCITKRKQKLTGTNTELAKIVALHNRPSLGIEPTSSPSTKGSPRPLSYNSSEVTRLRIFMINDFAR